MFDLDDVAELREAARHMRGEAEPSDLYKVFEIIRSERGSDPVTRMGDQGRTGSVHTQRQRSEGSRRPSTSRPTSRGTASQPHERAGCDRVRVRTRAAMGTSTGSRARHSSRRGGLILEAWPISPGTELPDARCWVGLRPPRLLQLSASSGILAVVQFRLAMVLIVLASCTNDDRKVEGTSTTTATAEEALVAGPPVVAKAQMSCDGPIQQLAAPPQGYETIGNSIALETSTSSATAFQTALTGYDDPALRLFTKTGLLVRTDAMSELIVPDDSAEHFGFQWNAPVTTHLVVGPCPGESNWIVFPGGYYVSEVGCFDFIVRAEDGDHNISVGLGSPCPGQTPPAGYSES